MVRKNSRKKECSALTSNLEGTVLNCVFAKRDDERDSASKIFKILLSFSALEYKNIRRQ